MRTISKIGNRLAILMIASGLVAVTFTSVKAAEITLKVGTSWNDKFPMKAMLKDVL
ncbi:MAG: hypothetical protein HQ512_05085, partial [Rhodospirillales bacterium]|nr:hypothetical protein [Rhodospirillales bacterium]